MNMEEYQELEKDVRDICWSPIIDYNDKVEQILKLLNHVYARGYHDGNQDCKKVLLKLIEENI